MPILRTCESCDGPISEKRLAAIPKARYCVVCQAARDLDPIESLGADRLAAGMAVCSEGDGDHFRLGGDSCCF